jgi:hypothetical protein
VQSLTADRPATRSAAAALHARLTARRARISGEPAAMLDAAALLDAALHGARALPPTVGDDLRLDRAALGLEAGIARRDGRLLDQAGRDKWEAANEAKKLARATVDTYFKRVVSYAFPKEKEPSESKSLETKLADLINQAIGKCEKAEAPAFDVSAALTGLRAALAAVTK